MQQAVDRAIAALLASAKWARLMCYTKAADELEAIAAKLKEAYANERT
jgi:DnaJ-domain-containing protein 1